MAMLSPPLLLLVVARLHRSCLFLSVMVQDVPMASLLLETTSTAVVEAKDKVQAERNSTALEVYVYMDGTR